MKKKSEMKLTADILEKKEEGKKKKIPFTQKVKKNVSFFFLMTPHKSMQKFWRKTSFSNKQTYKLQFKGM